MATVWSAPNYCHRYENLASILELDENLSEHFNIFEDAPENKREKKEPKPRDLYAAGQGLAAKSGYFNDDSSSSRGSTSASSSGQTRNN